MGTSSTFHNLPEDKQERILDQALSEFAAKGYARASLNSLVARLGIAKGSIFQYFRDKAGLFGHVFDFAVDMVKDHLRQVREATRGQEFYARLEASLSAGLELLDANPRLFHLYLRIMFEGGVPFRSQMQAAVLSLGRDYIVELMQDGMASGELDRDLDLDAAAFVVEAVLERFLVARAQEHLDPGLGLKQANPAEAAQRAAQVVRMIRWGLEGKP